MVFVGKQLEYANKLKTFDMPYIHVHEEQICRHVFSETLHGIKFTPFVLDSIIKTHKTIGYILRQQYKGSDLVYNQILKIPHNIALKSRNDQTNFAFAIWDRIVACCTDNEQSAEALCSFYENVKAFLIMPAMEKFNYYSPSMVWVLFYGLLMHVGCQYASDLYGLVWKQFLKDIFSLKRDKKNEIAKLQVLESLKSHSASMNDECVIVQKEVTCWCKHKH